ncbi:transmembrane protein DDB_G0273707/DDB_G0273361-like isoform X2 [Durio zibethinus]|uniref:Transmembrane protein DDB_G0273707/DDB_G0273361-like isoform X2 n=1 Tax=Durio zibethinus TaxID=66656 RepID=A0A6P6ATK5_DURZI|nr:transmembrane protein DDB_G0273707/DDB_G0273361-like isoform X2 [Durio zibethinus]
MATQLRANNYYYHQSNAMPATTLISSPSPSICLNSISPLLFKGSSLVRNKEIDLERSLGFETATSLRRKKRREYGVVVASSSNVAAPLWDSWKPEKSSSAPSLSDILWPSAGGFAAMAILGKLDQVLAPKGISMTIAPLGAVCAVLFASPSSPAARMYNMFMAQIGCAAIGVLAFSIFGPGWLARSAALAASIAFMIYTRSTHPPAASLPILFIDGVKLHHLNFWYAFFPGAAGCIILSLIQQVVCYLKDNFKF